MHQAMHQAMHHPVESPGGITNINLTVCLDTFQFDLLGSGLGAAFKVGQFSCLFTFNLPGKYSTKYLGFLFSLLQSLCFNNTRLDPRGSSSPSLPDIAGTTRT